MFGHSFNLQNEMCQAISNQIYLSGVVTDATGLFGVCVVLLHATLVLVVLAHTSQQMIAESYPIKSHVSKAPH